jgi:hypothetical protein
VWNGNWVLFSSVMTGPGPIDNQVYHAQLDVRDKVGFFRIRVTARELMSGGAYDREEYGPLQISVVRSTIKIM